jgi:hypothetical protein
VEHVPELRQLIHREPPQDSPDAGDARIGVVHRPARPLVFGPGNHRAQLEQVELLTVAPHPPLAVEDRAAVVELDRDGGDSDHGTREREPDTRAEEVDRTLHRVPSTFSQTGGTPKRA